MPTYEYRCTGCARKIEVQQSFSDAPKQTCDFCGEKLRRVFSPIGVLFKGRGFYSTDARSGGKKKTEEQSGNGDKQTQKPKTDAESKASRSKAPSGDGSPSSPKPKNPQEPA